MGRRSSPQHRIGLRHGRGFHVPFTLQAHFSVPEETQRVASCGCFPQRKPLPARMGDQLGSLYCDTQFANLFPTRGQPTASPARLALISTVLQYVEGLSDRQAADAFVRARIDWKYALGLELTDPGFDHTVLSEFRSHRLVNGQAEQQFLDTLLKLMPRTRADPESVARQAHRAR